jgi:sporulation protein YlmC with PRC-barrel domain
MIFAYLKQEVLKTMKKLRIISSKIKSLEETKSLKSYVGKKVFSSSGFCIGKIKDLVMKKNFLIGFILKKNKLFLDISFIKSESDKSVVLSINPIFSVIKMKVFDVDGRKIGQVVGLNRSSNINDFESLIVRKNFYTKINIPKKDVSTFKKNVILNQSYDTK